MSSPNLKNGEEFQEVTSNLNEETLLGACEGSISKDGQDKIELVSEIKPIGDDSSEDSLSEKERVRVASVSRQSFVTINTWADASETGAKGVQKEIACEVHSCVHTVGRPSECTRGLNVFPPSDSDAEPVQKEIACEVHSCVHTVGRPSACTGGLNVFPPSDCNSESTTPMES